MLFKILFNMPFFLEGRFWLGSSGFRVDVGKSPRENPSLTQAQAERLAS